MENRQRSSIVLGTLLVIVGLVFLLGEWVPELRPWLDIDYSWPLIVVGVGVFFLVMGLITGVPSLAIPATIVGGIGVMLYVQNATDAWESWAYAWTLIPGFVGLGMILAGLLGGVGPDASLQKGGGLIVTSLVLFTIFGSFFGALGFMGPYWALLLIGAGAILVAWALIQRR
jgi:hypothetical protein